MADNLDNLAILWLVPPFNLFSPEEVKRRLILFLRIPNETLTEVLKFFSRRDLVQKISPICYRLKQISDKNVKNVHIIMHMSHFLNKLNLNNPEAIKELEHLAGKKCQLGGQFRLTQVRMWISEKSQAILLHCSDLFNNCQINLLIGERNKKSPLYLECLSLLEKTKPIKISVNRSLDQIDFWHNPTFQNCTRVFVDFGIISAVIPGELEYVFEWLHRPSATEEQVRSLAFYYNSEDHIDWLVNRCTKDIQQAREPADRRSYVCSFDIRDWPGFDQFLPTENKSTGERLLLERVMNGNGEPSGQYRLRRCLTKEVANANGPYEEFGIDEEKTTTVCIQSLRW